MKAVQENINMKLSLGEPGYKQLFIVGLLSTRTIASFRAYLFENRYFEIRFGEI